MTNLKIAYQGEPGAYSEIAALRLGQPLPCNSFEEVFSAVENRRADMAVLPMENSLGGSIHQNYDLLLQHPVVIKAETFVKVNTVFWVSRVLHTPRRYICLAKAR